MGQCSFKHDNKLDHADTTCKWLAPYCCLIRFPWLASMSKNNFNFQYVIGRGGFGKVSWYLPFKFFRMLQVWRVEYRKTK